MPDEQRGQRWEEGEVGHMELWFFLYFCRDVSNMTTATTVGADVVLLLPMRQSKKSRKWCEKQCAWEAE
jgi:hypothetical protein